MERREFVRISCLLCVAIGGVVTLAELEACASAPALETEMRDKAVALPLAQFTGGEIQIVRPKNFGFDIAVRKLSDGTFAAFILRCTHASNQLEYDGSFFRCSLHGSTFSLDGTVARGPASKPLQSLTTRVEGPNVIIQL
jgi:Rieske Fe-S protein